MYEFATIIFLGLALVKVVDLLEGVVPAIKSYHSIVTMVLGVAGAVALDYSIFSNYGVEFNNADAGTWVTGATLAGVATAWRVVFNYLGGASEDETAGTTQSRPRIAA